MEQDFLQALSDTLRKADSNLEVQFWGPKELNIENGQMEPVSISFDNTVLRVVVVSFEPACHALSTSFDCADPKFDLDNMVSELLAIFEELTELESLWSY